MHDHNYIHNSEKLVNLFDNLVRTTQLDEYLCCLEHIGQVYNKFTFNKHGLHLEDVKRKTSKTRLVFGGYVLKRSNNA